MDSNNSIVHLSLLFLNYCDEMTARAKKWQNKLFAKVRWLITCKVILLSNHKNSSSKPLWSHKYDSPLMRHQTFIRCLWTKFRPSCVTYIYEFVFCITLHFESTYIGFHSKYFQNTSQWGKSMHAWTGCGTSAFNYQVTFWYLTIRD